MGASPSFPIVSLPRERVVIITGANTGIGYEAAKHIAMMGATVIMACRSEERAKEAIRRMNEEYQQQKSEGKLQEEYIKEDSLPVEFMKLDMASLKSVMEFVNAFRDSGRKLHVLLCNGGMLSEERAFTEDGFEKHFQVNYLSHFLLVTHLLPIMKSSGEDCRIVMTSSIGHKMGSFNLDKIQAKDPADYNAFAYYSHSKLYQIMQMFSLSRRLKGTEVTVTSIHPGNVKTEIAREYTDKKVLTALLKAATAVTVGLPKTPFEGAITLIDCAVNPKLRGVTADYFADCKPATISNKGRNESHQEELWKYSLECLKDYLPDDVLAGLEGSGSQ